MSGRRNELGGDDRQAFNPLAPFHWTGMSEE